MRSRSNGPDQPLSRWRPRLIGAALVLCACATAGTKDPEQSEARDESGFTIAEDVQVSEQVRADFQNAVRLLQQGQYESGIALLVKVTEEAPEVTTAHIDLAIAYSRVEDLDRAEASIKKALELSPQHPVAHNELGIIYRKTGRFEEARKSYEKALAVQPDFHFARRNLAILCDVYLVDLTCALENYELYARAAPADEAAALWIADLRNRAGK
jgi:tetratricopeptide (TPR) repeat protein